jgi:hypothetical protein
MTRHLGQRAESRLERVLGVAIAPDAVRHWPRSGEWIVGRGRIAEVESRPHA